MKQIEPHCREGNALKRVRYDNGLEKYFKRGEKSLYYDEEADRLILCVWDGKAWQPPHIDLYYVQNS